MGTEENIWSDRQQINTAGNEGKYCVHQSVSAPHIIHISFLIIFIFRIIIIFSFILYISLRVVDMKKFPTLSYLHIQLESLKTLMHIGVRTICLSCLSNNIKSSEMISIFAPQDIFPGRERLDCDLSFSFSSEFEMM